jgi:hypothetical protein
MSGQSNVPIGDSGKRTCGAAGRCHDLERAGNQPDVQVTVRGYYQRVGHHGGSGDAGQRRLWRDPGGLAHARNG